MVEIETLYRCIDKYLEGEATELERNKIDNWYQSFDRMPGFTRKEKKDVEKKRGQHFFQLISIKESNEAILVSAKWNII